MKKRQNLLILSSLFTVLLFTGLFLLLRPQLFKEEENRKELICQSNDLDALLEEYLFYVTNTFFDENEVISDPIEKYSNSNIKVTRGAVSEEYMTHAPSRMVNLIYATKLAEEYLNLDTEISTKLKEKYFSLVVPFSSLDTNSQEQNGSEQISEEAMDYISEQFDQYLTKKGLSWNELAELAPNKIDEEFITFIQDNEQELNQYLLENNISDIPAKILFLEAEETDEVNKYSSQNIFSFCYPLKYSTVLDENEKQYFVDMCLKNYSNIENTSVCTEDSLTSEALEEAITAFITNDRNLFTKTGLTEYPFENYYVFDLATDYYILSTIFPEEEIDSKCFVETGNYHLAYSLLKLSLDYQENGIYDNDGISQALSLLQYLVNLENTGLNNDEIKSLFNTISLNAQKVSGHLNTHDTNLQTVLQFESLSQTKDDVNIKEVFSSYCNNDNLPLSIYISNPDSVYLGSIDATSRMIVNLIFSVRE